MKKRRRRKRFLGRLPLVLSLPVLVVVSIALAVYGIFLRPVIGLFWAKRSSRSVRVSASLDPSEIERWLIYETRRVIVKVPLEDIPRALTKPALRYHSPSHMKAQEDYATAFGCELMKRTEQDILARDLERSDRYAAEAGMSFLLEQGRFVLTDKKSNRLVPDIEIVYYEYYVDPLWSGAGRRFCLPNGKVFYSTLDWIS